MAKFSEQGGRRAWARLSAWYRMWLEYRDGHDAPGHLSKPKEALSALKDAREVRLLLEEAELGAVRAARHAGYSWAEIAVALGVTKQAAWERWHEFDVPVDQSSGSP